MIAKSELYKSAIVADSRLTAVAGNFGFVPPGAVEGATVASSAIAEFADVEQVKNEVYSLSARWLTLERSGWPLDGSAVLIDGGGEFGFWSEQLSDENGNFATDVNVDYVLDNTYDLIGITVYFDDLFEQWATEFSVIYYGSDSSIVAQIDIVENNKTVVLVDLQGTAVKTIRVKINKWCLPLCRARVLEMLPGQIYLFDNSNTNSLAVNELIEPFASSFALSELVLTFDNYDKKFDFLNPTGVFAFLKQKMMLKTQIGLMIGAGFDYTNAGNRYLYNIPSDEQTDTAIMACQPSLAFATEFYPTDSKALSTVAAVVARIWELAGLSETYTIDSALQNVTVNGYCGENVTLRDALALVATAAGGYWFINRDGNYEMRPIVAAIPSDVVATISYDDMLSKPKITQNPRITAVKVTANYFATSTFDDYLDWTSVTIETAAAVNDGSSVTIDSPFLRYGEQAELIGQLALEYYAARRMTFVFQYRGDMALEVGDCISIETDYGFKNIVITEHTFSIDNADFLTATIKGVG